MQKLNEPFREKDMFGDLFFSTVWEKKIFFPSVFGWYFALGSVSVDPHNFTDPDPRIQNVAQFSIIVNVI